MLYFGNSIVNTKYLKRISLKYTSIIHHESRDALESQEELLLELVVGIIV